MGIYHGRNHLNHEKISKLQSCILNFFVQSFEIFFNLSLNSSP